METLHDLLFWALIAISGCLPMFMVIWVWMVFYTRENVVKERLKEGLELNTGAFATGVMVKVVACLVISYVFAYVGQGALSHGDLPAGAKIAMAFIPITCGTLTGALVVLAGKLMYQDE